MTSRLNDLSLIHVCEWEREENPDMFRWPSHQAVDIKYSCDDLDRHLTWIKDISFKI